MGAEHRHELRRSYIAPGATGHLGLDPGQSTETTRVLRQLPIAADARRLPAAAPAEAP